MKIAIIRKNGIGDFIAGCVPLCNYLIQQYGKIEFHFFMSERNASVVKYFFPDAKVHIFKQGNKYLSHWKMAKQWRHLDFDIGISPAPNSPKLNNLFLYWLGAKKRYGNIEGWISQKCLNTVSFCEDPFKHVGLASLQLLEQEMQTIPAELYPQIDKNRIKIVPLQNYSCPYIMVEVSNARPSSQLTNDKLAILLNDLAKTKKFSILITAMKKDEDKAKELQTKLLVQSETHITPTFDEYVSYVNKADIVLCGDGGLGHLSGALGKKIVACYAETSLTIWSILSESVTHFYDSDNVNNISNNKIIQALEDCLK
ncbi:MAG: hypothetical protein MJ048_00090 [Acidaminococcaceae bacterium]|nr:hypothetical protein [Acidaminococcaceae bacterium]